MAIASTKKMIGFLRYASPQFKSTTSIAALDITLDMNHGLEETRNHEINRKEG